MKYRIELTEEQMRVLERSTELFMRLGMGQTWDLADMLCEGMLKDYDNDKPESKVIFERYITRRDAIRKVLSSAMGIAYDPLYSPKYKTEDGMIAECIWDAIRCARGKSIYGTPMQIGSEPIPKIEVEDNENGKQEV